MYFVLFLFMYLFELEYFICNDIAFDVFCLTPEHPWKTVLSLIGCPQAKEDVMK